MNLWVACLVPKSRTCCVLHVARDIYVARDAHVSDAHVSDAHVSDAQVSDAITSRALLHLLASFSFCFSGSNIPLQIRWFMLEAGLKGTQKMMYADLCFAVTFLICRVLWAPTLLYVVILSHKPHWSIKLGGSALQLISWAWASVVWGKLVNSIKTAGSNNSASRAQKKES